MRATMSVLTRDVILRELDEGRIQIDPIDRSQIGVASIVRAPAEEPTPAVEPASGGD